MKKQKINVTQKEKAKSKNELKISRCSPEFQNFIDIANLLKSAPNWGAIPTRNELFIKYVYEPPLVNGVINTEEEEDYIIDLYKKYLTGYPEQILDFVFNTKGRFYSEFELDKVETCLAYLRSISVGISALAHTEQVAYESVSGSTLIELWNRMLFEYPDQSADVTVRIYLDENGFMKISTNPFLEYIAQNKIQANRIRVCEICENIFWAKREESRTCSQKCSQAFRQRRWRETNKEDYNEKRRRNYAYKKSINKGKEKKNNGTL